VRLSSVLPVLIWGRAYRRADLVADLLAAVVVTILLVPQGLAYATLAGLPPEVGLYASIAPVLAYALLGTSRALAVGPVAVLSLMSLTAAGMVAPPGTPAFAEASALLALLSGAMLVLMGVLRLGFLANLLSHPVVSAFISASALLIALSQVRHLLGLPPADGTSAAETIAALARTLPETDAETLAVGGFALLFLAWSRRGAQPLLVRLGLPAAAAAAAARAAPALAVAAGMAAVVLLGLEADGVRTLGAIPAGLPPLALPALEAGRIVPLLLPAFLIALIGFVESVSVAQTLAARRRETVRPDQELVALGAANLAAGLTGGFSVTGGFARSVVNFDAGARTPAAGAFTALGILSAVLFLGPALAPLPHAVLAATIIVSVLSLIDLGVPRTLLAYSRPDFAAYVATALATIAVGVEAGVVAGVLFTIGVTLWRTSRPHVAIVGQVPGTQHYRNVRRHAVITRPEILSVRIDESLSHLNVRTIEAFLLAEIAARPEVRHLVLMCSGINAIDASGLEMLEALTHRLAEAGVLLHLSEVKGPVMDRLRKTRFLAALSGRVFLSQHEAVRTLAEDAPAGHPPPPGRPPHGEARAEADSRPASAGQGGAGPA